MSNKIKIVFIDDYNTVYGKYYIDKMSSYYTLYLKLTYCIEIEKDSLPYFIIGYKYIYFDDNTPIFFESSISENIDEINIICRYEKVESEYERNIAYELYNTYKKRKLNSQISFTQLKRMMNTEDIWFSNYGCFSIFNKFFKNKNI